MKRGRRNSNGLEKEIRSEHSQRGSKVERLAHPANTENTNPLSLKKEIVYGSRYTIHKMMMMMTVMMMIMMMSTSYIGRERWAS
jgi:hypothetical protein